MLIINLGIAKERLGYVISERRSCVMAATAAATDAAAVAADAVTFLFF